MTQYAKFDVRSCWLGFEFGESYARKLFGDAAVDALPRYVRGKSAGKFKADITWVKCREGGWISTGPAYQEQAVGRVENRSGKVLCAALRVPDKGIVATHGDVQYFHHMGA